MADDGSLYYLARGTGSVYRVTYTAAQGPTIGTHPASKSVSVGQPATFTVSASGTPPLSYLWQRNGVDIPGSTSSSYTVSSAQLSDNGARFRARVSNASGSVFSNEATLTVTTNQSPTATITLPTAGTFYSGGETISYAGTGSDPEDGPDLAATQFTWRVDFHHDTHFHPHVPDTTGSKTGTFVIAATGETSSNVWYRIHLTVRDSAGNTNSTFRDILPRTANVTLATNPGGLQVNLDGQPQTTPVTFTGVVGVQRTIEAPQQQIVNGSPMYFASWSDGGARSHTISTPASATTYTATYQATPPAAAAFVKSLGNATLSRSGNANLTFSVSSAGVAAGNTVVLAVTAGTFAGPVGCTDSKGNVYTVDADIRGSSRLFVCSSRNVAALGPNDSITATYPGFSGLSAVVAGEYRGISSVGPSATRSGNSVSPSASVSANAGDLVVGAVAYGSTPTFASACGFTLAGEASGGAGSGRKVVAAEYLIAPTTQGYPACGALSSARPWLAAAVVYRP